MSRATNSPARSPAAPSLVGPPVRSGSRGHLLGDAGAAPDLRADSRTGYRSEAGCHHIGHRGGPRGRERILGLEAVALVQPLVARDGGVQVGAHALAVTVLQHRR
jgi:hypothetical protein